MEMDVYGKKATSKRGEYFRANVWSWRPIWHYCESLAPLLCAKVKHAQYNNGDGLGSDDAITLGRKVLDACESGAAAVYIAERTARLDALPLKECWLCHGTGKRTDMVVADGCNACSGTGKLEQDETHYNFSLDHLKEFGEFLLDCGGFNIY